MSCVITQNQILFDDFRDAWSELLSNYSVNSPRVEDDLDTQIDCNMTSIVGLSSPELSASISILTSRETVESLASSPIDCPADWLGELANQLAGRLKNKLSPYQLQLNLSTPTTVQGSFLQLSTSKNESFGTTAYLKSGAAIAQMTLVVDPSYQFIEKCEDPSSEEGSLELF